MLPPVAGYVELQVASNYSFLRGASHVEELFLAARALGYDALAITDHNSLAGFVRAHACAEEVGLRLVVGCRFELRDGQPVLAYSTDRAAYSRLCRLLTLGKARAGKGGFDIGWQTWSRMRTACCWCCCRTRRMTGWRWSCTAWPRGCPAGASCR